MSELRSTGGPKRASFLLTADRVTGKADVVQGNPGLIAGEVAGCGEGKGDRTSAFDVPRPEVENLLLPGDSTNDWETLNRCPIDKLRIESYSSISDQWMKQIQQHFCIPNTYIAYRKNQFRYRINFNKPFNFTLEFFPVTMGWYRSAGEFVTGPVSRLQLNPNKIGISLSRLLDFLTELYLDVNLLFVRRLDIKWDDKRDFKFWNQRVLFKNAKKLRLIRSIGGATLYQGSLKGNNLIIYEKHKEVFVKTGKVIGQLTRLEQRMRFDLQDLPLIELLQGNIHVFDRVEIFDRHKLSMRNRCDQVLLKHLKSGKSLVESLRVLKPDSARSLKERIRDEDATEFLRNQVADALFSYLSPIQERLLTFETASVGHIKEVKGR